MGKVYSSEGCADAMVADGEAAAAENYIDNGVIEQQRQRIWELESERTLYRQALEEIRGHWANQYDHPRKASAMYAGPYGIGVTDGHRACAIIAERAIKKFTDGPSREVKNV